jgi:hypothetical protein
MANGGYTNQIMYHAEAKDNCPSDFIIARVRRRWGGEGWVDYEWGRGGGPLTFNISFVCQSRIEAAVFLPFKC